MASSIEAEDKWHEARGSPDWLKVVALPLMREERVSVSQRRLLLCRIAASYLCGATSLRFLEQLMISKSPLIERLNQPKAKKHSCYCEKVQGNCILFLK